MLKCWDICHMQILVLTEEFKVIKIGIRPLTGQDTFLKTHNPLYIHIGPAVHQIGRRKNGNP